jgi:hypothetical protein
VVRAIRESSEALGCGFRTIGWDPAVVVDIRQFSLGLRILRGEKFTGFCTSCYCPKQLFAHEEHYSDERVQRA